MPLSSSRIVQNHINPRAARQPERTGTAQHHRPNATRAVLATTKPRARSLLTRLLTKRAGAKTSYSLLTLCFARTGRGQLCADQTSETCRAHLSCRTSGSRFRSKLPEGLGESFLSSGESDGSPSIPLDLRAS